jgi:hypothetical protein
MQKRLGEIKSTRLHSVDARRASCSVVLSQSYMRRAIAEGQARGPVHTVRWMVSSRPNFYALSVIRVEVFEYKVASQ